jgi:hypothetical protein
MLTLNPDDSYGYETAWPNSGGGVSAYEPQPWYQANTGYGMRSVPDIALDAGSGDWVYDSLVGGWADIGGTSDAAPQMAAMIAIADEGRALNGLGSLDGPSQTLPEINAFLPYYDVNAIVGEPYYSLYTGWGSPAANNLIPDLASGAYDPPGTDFAAFSVAAAGQGLGGAAAPDFQTHGGGGHRAPLGVNETASILQDARRHRSGGHGTLIGVAETAARDASSAGAIGAVSPDLFDVGTATGTGPAVGVTPQSGTRTGATAIGGLAEAGTVSASRYGPLIGQRGRPAQGLSFDRAALDAVFADYDPMEYHLMSGGRRGGRVLGGPTSPGE